MTERPLVHVVVVDYDGGALTLDCLRSILASDWPADRLRVVLVDNASSTPVTDTVTAELPRVQVVRSDENRGLAGGANLGMRERGDADFVALVNNDATVTPGWLDPLVATFADPAARIGAACPKILLAAPAVEVTIDGPTHRRGRGDRRDLGVRLSGTRVGADDLWRRTQLVEGFWGGEPMPAAESGGQWTAGRALLRVPVLTAEPPSTVGLRLAADAPVDVTVRAGSATTTLAVGTSPEWYEVATDGVPVEVVNNVGTVVAADGYCADRGWLEIDRGQYDEPVDVAAWCGAAVLLAKAYLDDVGLFDERLFLYYEDVELSRRGTRRGWRYRTAPDSIVRHVHSATSVEGSPLATHYNERNRLLVHCAHAGLGDVSRTFVRHLAVTGSYAVRDVVAPALRGQRPHAAVVGGRLRALGAAAARLPGMRRNAPVAGPS
ncbi:MAG: glycosyltransferase family 2 protein [Actinobacteria bacterium]|nr:glycosyltransferase family 2 protein [Actinomycetota bacterium]